MICKKSFCPIVFSNTLIIDYQRDSLKVNGVDCLDNLGVFFKEFDYFYLSVKNCNSVYRIALDKGTTRRLYLTRFFNDGDMSDICRFKNVSDYSQVSQQTKLFLRSIFNNTNFPNIEIDSNI